MCEFRKGAEDEFRNRVSHDGRVKGGESGERSEREGSEREGREEREGRGEFHHSEEERSPYISIFYTVNLTSFRLAAVLKMKFIRDFTNFARTLRLGRKVYQFLLFILQSD